MRWQGRNLRAGLTGTDVAALHEELVRLGYQVPEAERSQRLLGVGTAEAVAAFQVAHGLVDTLFADVGTRPAGVTLRFYAPGFGGRRTLVGEAVTGPDGGYTVDPDVDTDLRRLEVRAVAADGSEHPLAGPDRFDPAVPVTMVIPAAKLPVPQAEYTRL